LLRAERATGYGPQATGQQGVNRLTSLGLDRYDQVFSRHAITVADRAAVVCVRMQAGHEEFSRT